MSSDNQQECVNCRHEGKYHKNGCSIPVKNKYGKMDYCNCEDFKSLDNKHNRNKEVKRGKE